MSQPTLKEKVVDYPPPKTTEANIKGMKYDPEIDKKNYAKNPGIKLPLSEKKDKYGENYTNIPQLIKDLGLSLENIKDYKYENERTKPFHNNNSEGESKRFDMKKSGYPQFEYSIWLHNESDDEGEEVSCKHWGPHPSNGAINRADTFIMMVDNDGKKAHTQIEPSHMDESEHQKYNYSGKFNNMEVNVPKLTKNKFSLRYIRLANIPSKEVIGIVAIKYDDEDDKWKDWNVIYETHVFDGQGGGPVSGGKGREEQDPTEGGRALKDPFRPWIVTALGIDPLDEKDGPQITVRMDSQPATDIEEGKHYKNARVTEIVDFELV
jgi:hypothetical protein